MEPRLCLCGWPDDALDDTVLGKMLTMSLRLSPLSPSSSPFASPSPFFLLLFLLAFAGAVERSDARLGESPQTHPRHASLSTALCLHTTRNEGSRSRTPLLCPLPSLAWLVPCSHWHTQPSPTGSHFGSPRSSITGRGHQHPLLRVLVCIYAGVYTIVYVYKVLAITAPSSSSLAETSKRCCCWGGWYLSLPFKLWDRRQDLQVQRQ